MTAEPSSDRSPDRSPDRSLDAPLDAADWFAVLRAADQARSRLLATRSSDRARALQLMARSLAGDRNKILEANTIDLEACRDKPLPAPLMAWLKLSPERLDRVVELLQRLGDLPDPIRQAVYATQPVSHAQTYCQLMPLGTIAFVYECLTDLGAIAAAMCLKTANCCVLYGNREAKHTHAAIAQALQAGLADSDLPTDCLAALASDRDISIRDLVAQDRYLNLVIPYGRPKLVQQVSQWATAPVLRASMGNCYLYWAPSGELDAARWAITDSHLSRPDPVNAIEKVLVHERHNPSTLAVLLGALQQEGFEVRVNANLAQQFPHLPQAAESEWNQPYLSRTVAFKAVDSLETAIATIRDRASGHADCIITESYREAHQFALTLDSASTYINTSPRFQHNPKGSASVFLGMSNQKGYRRGPIGLEALTTLKQIVQGDGEP